MGETLRHLVSKCLCQVVRDPAKRYLLPPRIGVAARFGAEAAVHATRQWAQCHAGHATKVLVNLDFQNAFNTVDRGALLRLVRLGLVPWAEWCYDRLSRPLFRTTQYCRRQACIKATLSARFFSQLPCIRHYRLPNPLVRLEVCTVSWMMSPWSGTTNTRLPLLLSWPQQHGNWAAVANVLRFFLHNSVRHVCPPSFRAGGPPVLYCRGPYLLGKVGPGVLTAEAWDIAGLCTSPGGLGIRHVSQHSEMAHLASVLAMPPLFQALDSSYRGLIRGLTRQPKSTTVKKVSRRTRFAPGPTLPATGNFPSTGRRYFATAGCESFQAQLHLQQQPHVGV